VQTRGVAVCTSCGAENREGARFCDSCGAALAEPVAAGRETRKTVSVLFADVTGSTRLGERLDPESLRQVMARYFDVAKNVVERHGGVVEKFIGDAVMAVFGVPAVHEDDALRAVRAAQELRNGLATLNDELESSYGIRLELRTGVNTGEVVTGTAERLATGDAVNVAARLEQAANPGEILLGGTTYGLVTETVVAEPAPPLEVKGKSDTLTAYRLLAVHADAAPVARRGQAPMIGREQQRQLLEHAYANAVGARACNLFTILGAAGVGKSRLASEFLSSLDGATVASGRCLSYGEGISYWPVTEVVLQLDPDEREGQALASILGDEHAASTPDQTAWAFRKLLERRAREQPLVVVFDDVHWGEPVFLDLVEHVADLSRDAPILLLCMARGELLDRRPAWGGGKLNATNVLLEPLAEGDAGALLDRLLPGDGLDESLRNRILESADGNPLFVEEMVAMVAEAGTATDVVVPPTIQALLAARLDQLDDGERRVLERGSVEGQVFHRGAVVALSNEEPQVDGRLVTLVRKDLVRPEQAALADDEAYRFRHLLIRDTAYEALPKGVRSELHERMAAWLDERAAALVELDELVGYHLEQSYRYRVELGPEDSDARALGTRAAHRLHAAGDRAYARGDVGAAQSLLVRASEVSAKEDEVHRLVLLRLAEAAVSSGTFDRGLERLRDVEALADRAGDERARLRAALTRLDIRVSTDGDLRMADCEPEARQLAEALAGLGDFEGAARGFRLAGNFAAWLGRCAEGEEIWKRALELAERAGSQTMIAETLTWRAWGWWFGAVTVEEGVHLCEENVRRLPGNPGIEAASRLLRGGLLARLGETDEARSEIAVARALYEDLGQVFFGAGAAMVEADAELVLGNPERALAAIEPAVEAMRTATDTGYLSTSIAYQGETLFALGRYAEAAEAGEEAMRLAGPDDIEPHMHGGAVRAAALARLGDLEGAEKGIAAARALGDATDLLTMREFMAFMRAEVERAAGRADGEREALRDALDLAERKGDVVGARKAREALERLDG
jgi:class 3 adenylate cyclase/tetratricopeptide (TPR) repeat protein